MILQALDQLYDRLIQSPDYEIAPPGFSLQKITFRIVLHPDGRLHDIQDARIQDEAGKFRPRQLVVPGDTKPPGSGINPCFLWDAPKYILGYDPDNFDRARKLFEAFRDSHLGLRTSIDVDVYSAVCDFLASWDPIQCEKHPIIQELSQGYGVFQIIGELGYVHERQEIIDWWNARGDEAGLNGVVGQCLVTQRTGRLARVQRKIKGVQGGQSDQSLVSFNADAYESYGKEQAFNAPVLEEVSFRYSTALNALLDGPMRWKHRRVLADTTIVFWTEQPSLIEDVFAPFLLEEHYSRPSPMAQDESLLAKIDKLMGALKIGRPAYTEMADDPDRTSFYLLGMSPNAARISVRFFLRGTITQLLDNLRRHHEHIGIVTRFDSDRPFPGNAMLLQETARDKDGIPPLLPGALMRAVIMGTDYPQAMYGAILRRIVADREINFHRAGFIKGFLIRNRKLEVPMALDVHRTEPAYRLGRLFAALEKTQTDALGGVNAGLRDRYYASASATPATVFPRLLRTYQHHLGKMESGRISREQLIQEIVSPLERFPSHFDMNDQGLFAIGYYHQMKDFYTKKSDKLSEEV